MPENAINPGNKKNNKAGLLIFIITILICLNIVSYFFHFQADFTADKRYTITPATHKMLKNINSEIEVSVFLKGEDFPAAFKKLSLSTSEILERFRTISNHKIEYHFKDPLSNDTAVLNTLMHYRMQGVPITVSAGKKGTIQKMIFPWILVKNKSTGMAIPVFLPESNTPELSRTILNKTEMLLEYNLANAIKRVVNTEKAKIAYLTGNGQPVDFSIVAMYSSLMQYYQLDTFNLQTYPQIPEEYKCVIVNRPLLQFSETDQYKIDQFIMSGGNVLFAINTVSGNLDSFSSNTTFNAMPIQLNLSNFLFHYGVRINNNLIKDAVEHVFIPLTSAAVSEESVMYPWVYFPVLKPGSDHPVVKNMNGILTSFVSSIDINSNDPQITKTVLLSSSKYSMVEGTPTPILLNMAFEDIKPATYTMQNLPAAILLEGKFQSAFANRIPDTVLKQINSGLLTKPIASRSETGKMIIISDADIFANDIGEKGPFDLGIYRYSDYRFDNKSFLLNSIEYLSDENNLMDARNKNFENRILDPKLVNQERGKWQLINIGLPSIFIIFSGTLWFFLRKKKWTSVKAND